MRKTRSHSCTISWKCMKYGSFPRGNVHIPPPENQLRSPKGEVPEVA